MRAKTSAPLARPAASRVSCPCRPDLVRVAPSVGNNLEARPANWSGGCAFVALKQTNQSRRPPPAASAAAGTQSNGRPAGRLPSAALNVAGARPSRPRPPCRRTGRPVSAGVVAQAACPPQAFAVLAMKSHRARMSRLNYNNRNRIGRVSNGLIGFGQAAAHPDAARRVAPARSSALNWGALARLHRRASLGA
jgi:hypothetical protein